MWWGPHFVNISSCFERTRVWTTIEQHTFRTTRSSEKHCKTLGFSTFFKCQLEKNNWTKIARKCKNHINPYVFEYSWLRGSLLTTTNQGTARRKNLIKPIVVSIFCCSKGLRQRAAGRPPDGRRTPLGPPTNVIRPILFYVFGKIIIEKTRKRRRKHFENCGNSG